MRVRTCLPVLALLSGCATTHGTPGDPYEKFNRAMWSVDMKLDHAVMRPVAKGYMTIMPRFLRRGLSNMAANVEEPFSVINAALQGKPVRALNSFGRFLINTTIGIGGFRDVASKVGYKQAPEDLGQTFAVWGAKKSSYLVLPFYGPTTIRDGIGTFAAQWVDPYRIVIRKELDTWPAFGLTAFEFVDARANLIDSGADALLDSSADSYAVARSAYLQRRDAQIEDHDGDSAGAGGDDAALNAALNELGPTDASTSDAAANAKAPDQSQPKAPSLSPDQPKPTYPDTAKPHDSSHPQ